MYLAHTSDKAFIQRLTDIVEINLGDENFGVKELAREAGLNYSQINRRLKKSSGKNLSQFIREVRLQKAMEMLQNENITASESAYKVGFGSPTYFNHCFHDYFDYPPGEAKSKVIGEEVIDNNSVVTGEDEFTQGKQKFSGVKNVVRRKFLFFSAGFLFLVVIGSLVYVAIFKNAGSDPGVRPDNREKSIAVLPFNNLSEEIENQYFADGIAEDILTNLSHIRELKVISRTSTEQFRGSTKTSPEIAKILGVNYILEGSVQRSGDKVRVRVQFIDAGNDRHLLSETYDRELADIFKIQSDVARLVANELQATLSAKEIEKINQIPTRNIEAYNLCLMGRFLWGRRKKPDQLNSIKYFEKALAIDPDYALAYAGLADAYFILTCWGWYPNPEGYSKAKELTLKALNLDNNLAEAHATLGGILCYSEWNWEEARKELLLATEMNPDYATAHQYYSEFLDVIGDRAGARASINKAIELEPFTYMINALNAYYYFNEGRLKESLDAYLKTQEIDPDQLSSYWYVFHIHLKLGEELKAVEAFQKYMIRDTISKQYVKKVKDVYKRSGITGLLNLSIDHEMGRVNPSCFIVASDYVLLRENDRALDWIEKAMEKRIMAIPRINSHLILKELHSEPRFQALIKKMGLTDYQRE